MTWESVVTKAAERVADAIQTQADALVSAHDAGASLRQVAKWSGLNHETVRTIVKRRIEERLHAS